jgi:hypothetical protein
MKLDVNLKDLIEVDGQLVERDALKIVEKIKAYDPNLEVICVDPASGPGINEAPFIIAEHCPDGKLRRVFEAWQLDDRVVERVWAADQQKFDTLAEIDRVNATVKANNERRYADENAQAADITAHIVAARRSSYSFHDRNGEKVTIREDLPVGLRDADFRKSF